MTSPEVPSTLIVIGHPDPIPFCGIAGVGSIWNPVMTPVVKFRLSDPLSGDLNVA